MSAYTVVDNAKTVIPLTAPDDTELLEKTPIISALELFSSLRAKEKLPEFLCSSLKDRITAVKRAKANLDHALNNKDSRTRWAIGRTAGNTILLAGVPAGIWGACVYNPYIAILSAVSGLGYMCLGAYSGCVSDSNYGVHQTLNMDYDEDGMIASCTGLLCGPCISGTEACITIPKHIARLESKLREKQTSLDEMVIEWKDFCSTDNPLKRSLIKFLEEKISSLKETMKKNKEADLKMNDILLEVSKERADAVRSAEEKNDKELSYDLEMYTKAQKELLLAIEYTEKNLLPKDTVT